MRTYFLLRLAASIGGLFGLGMLLSAFTTPHAPEEQHARFRSLPPDAAPVNNRTTDLFI